MKKASRNTRVFASVQIIGWAVAVIFMAWVFSGCNGGGSSDDYGYVYPPCVNEIVPCLDEGPWNKEYIFIDQDQYEIRLYSWGDEFYITCYFWGQEGFYKYYMLGWADTCTEGTPYIYRNAGKSGPWYDIEGTLQICADALYLELWEPGAKNFQLLEGKNPTTLK